MKALFQPLNLGETSQRISIPIDKQIRRSQSPSSRIRLSERQSSNLQQASPMTFRTHNKSLTRMSSIIQQPLNQTLNSLDQISTTNTQLHSLINTLSTQLQSTYHTKQTQLIQRYKQQLIQAHKDLNDLKNNINQQQIKNQMDQKALQLKKQRLELIQINMYYSNKCLEYKKVLEQVTNKGGELDREIKFLEKQLDNSTNKRVQLMGQVYERNNNIKRRGQSQTKVQGILPMQSQRKTDIKDRSALSTYANTQTLRKLSGTKSKNMKIQLGGQVKKLFEDKLGMEDKIGLIEEKGVGRLAKMNQMETKDVKDPKEIKETKQMQRIFLQAVKGVRNKKVKDAKQQFTTNEKKVIMKQFLGKEEVKEFIYKIIFDKVEDGKIFKKKQKVNIYKDEKKEE